MSSAEPQDSKSDTTTAEFPSRDPQDDISNHFIFEPQNVLLFLLALRLFNALTVHTFFQPDEYFQALEPAWKLAFGEGAGAWITWVRLSHFYLSILFLCALRITYREDIGMERTLAFRHTPSTFLPSLQSCGRSCWAAQFGQHHQGRGTARDSQDFASMFCCIG
jgi:hypothetical protein